jgi:hypothetical protein
MDDRELTLAGLLADPMTLALMAADKVDPVELTAAWTALARKLALAHEAERQTRTRTRGGTPAGAVEVAVKVASNS